MKRLILFPLVAAIVLLYGVAHNQTWELRSSRPPALDAGHVPPADFLRVVSLGYEGIVSDNLFLQLITYFGEHILYGVRLSEEDWDYFVQATETITDLDPYFLDPYFLAEGFLAWESGRVKAANRILAKGAEARTWDWRLPYFLGFNSFYFLKDYERGAEWIMRAANIPGSPSYLPTLASRLAYYGGQARTGIAFLKEFRDQVSEPALRASIDRRIEALEIAADLEIAVAAFKEQYGRFPQPMQELAEKGIIDEVPPDPYGGKWGILENGRIFSTSKFVDGAGR